MIQNWLLKQDKIKFGVFFPNVLITNSETEIHTFVLY